MTAKRDDACPELKRQANLSRFEVSLVYIKSSRTARATEKNNFQRTNNNKTILVITQDKTHSQLFRDNIVVY